MRRSESEIREIVSQKPGRYLTPEEALRKLDGVEARLRTVHHGYGGDLPAVDIRVDCEWMELCRADVLDQVRSTNLMATDIPNGEPQQAVEYYRNKIRYGARIDKGSFYVLDSLTDG